MKNPLFKSKKAQGGAANRITDSLIGIVIITSIAVAIIPLSISGVINLSSITGNPVGALFSGVLVLLIFIGLFRAVLSLIGALSVRR